MKWFSICEFHHKLKDQTLIGLEKLLLLPAIGLSFIFINRINHLEMTSV